MGKKMDQWIKDHSINGPSSGVFRTQRENEVQLFYNIDQDSWAIVDNLNMLEYTKEQFGIYYIVFKDEYIKFLKKN